MSEVKTMRVEMNFCRRCGSKLRPKSQFAFKCEQGHMIFLNAAPAVGVLITKDNSEVLVLERAIDPGKGLLDVPGGFCDGPEGPLAAIARELEEEVGLLPKDYTEPEFIFCDVDLYEYGNEVGAVFSMIYRARLKTNKQPVAADDAAAAVLMPIQDVPLDKVYFPLVREGYARLKQPS